MKPSFKGVYAILHLKNPNRFGNSIMGFLTEAVLVVFGAVVTPILAYFVTKRLRSKKAVENQLANLSSSISVMRELEKVRQGFGASRAYITSFHNGAEISIGELHWEKLSIVCERVDNVTAPVLLRMKDIPAMQYAFIVHKLATEKRMQRSLHDHEDETDSGYFLREFKVHDEFMVPVRDRHGRVAGIVGCMFHSGRADNWGEPQWTQLNNLAILVKERFSAMK